MSIPLPTRSQLLGGLAGVLTWGIMTGLQAYGLAPIASQFVPALLNILQAAGVLGMAVVPQGADPLSFLVGLLVKMLVSNVLIRYWPSAKELNNMVISLAKALPTAEKANPKISLRKSKAAIDTFVQDQDSISAEGKEPIVDGSGHG